MDHLGMVSWFRFGFSFHLSAADSQDRLTLNRPKALNALSDGLMSALFQRLQEAPAIGFDPQKTLTLGTIGGT